MVVKRRKRRPRLTKKKKRRHKIRSVKTNYIIARTFKITQRRAHNRCPICKRRKKFSLIDFTYDKAKACYVDVYYCRHCRQVYGFLLTYLRDSLLKHGNQHYFVIRDSNPITGLPLPWINQREERKAKKKTDRLRRSYRYYSEYPCHLNDCHP